MVDQGPVSGPADVMTASSEITVDTSSRRRWWNRPVYQSNGRILWIPGPGMSPSCRFRERDTGSWKDGLAIIGGLPCGFGVCCDSIILLLLSDFGAGWSTGGCLAGHFNEVTARLLTSWDARLVWCRSWGSRRSAPFLCVI